MAAPRSPPSPTLCAPLASVGSATAIVDSLPVGLHYSYPRSSPTDFDDAGSP
ncbi:hypothetical protein M407DRAFT_23126 [Tulasnella calospora MUT 4182]|uniref:Uncharacterized protein n=1 Tax=Tulasnella calospora MUT 4182 TaxID=1051891 RepID=A0A0C3L1I3_9AGAM|nr:hypothetical protein M407DRAFT_23126 [Tulasnella calospora MUT 4182]